MSKKKTVYLKIEEDEFVAMAKDIVNPSILVMQLLRDHQLDVTEFEANVAYAYHLGDLEEIQLCISGEFCDELNEDDKLQVLVVKPKKPEVKDEPTPS